MATLQKKRDTAAMLMAAIGQATEDGVLDEMVGWAPGYDEGISEFVDALEWATERMADRAASGQTD
jgi:hypothetical protein